MAAGASLHCLRSICPSLRDICSEDSSESANETVTVRAATWSGRAQTVASNPPQLRSLDTVRNVSISQPFSIHLVRETMKSLQVVLLRSLGPLATAKSQIPTRIMHTDLRGLMEFGISDHFLMFRGSLFAKCVREAIIEHLPCDRARCRF